MFKKITWILSAVLLAALVAGALWWLYQREQDEKIMAEAFIPDNSAIVFRVRDDARLPAGLPVALARDVSRFRRAPLYRVIDALTRAGIADSASITAALRVEGKENVRFLYILNRNKLLYRGDLTGFLEQSFPGDATAPRDFEGNKIRALLVEKTEVYYALLGGLALLSDSRLYLEDALKRANIEPGSSAYERACHYFSSAAGVNVFLNADCFNELLPLYIKKYTGGAGIPAFAWGALDGYLAPEGATFNGFLHPGEQIRSFPGVLRGQRAAETRLDGVLPADVKAVSALRLSDTRKYLEDLDTYRAAAKIDETVAKRKKEYARWFGADAEKEWQELFRGEIAKGVMEISPDGEEEGVIVIHLKSGSKGERLLQEMIARHARQTNAAADSARYIYRVDQKQVVYHAMPATDFCSVTWGEIFDGMPARYAFIQENYLVLASSRLAVQRFTRDYLRRSSVRDMAWYKRVKERLGVNHNWMHVAATAPVLPLYRKQARGEWANYLRVNGERLAGISAWGYQWSGEEGMLYTSIAAGTEKVDERETRVMWQTKLDADIALKPAIVKNHVTGERELLVQDKANTLYLVSDVGLVLWKLPVQGEINSEIYQVDFYKNGKLQYLFSTPTHLYLVDRNGAYLPRYPLPLRSRCEVGITLFDYDNNRDYRVAAPGADRALYLFGLDGNPVKGWEMPAVENTLVSRLYHFRIENRDYLVVLDRGRLYMLDRRGKRRVKVEQLFDAAANTPLYLSRRQGKPVVLFADARRQAWWVDFEGNTGSWKHGDSAAPYHLNVGDVNADGLDEWIFAAGGTLSIHDNQGRVIQEKRWDDATLGFPYIYRFSARDARVGMLDSAGGRLLLLDKKQADTQGFPLPGATPFSIAFHGGDGEAAAGFYLFTGAPDGYLLKYRVQD
ncbi:MAG: WD40 repeat domain-containing protein [Odoribacteraceae bacterium]|jgi:hypothetical protein|nr:WD40 repeat domain-containing protein [Odoribacteraceae bacterium]